MLALPKENRKRAVNWLLDQQITKKGDWSSLVPELAPGGWTFEYFNDFNPDCDDTAMALEGLAKSDLSHSPKAKTVVQTGLTWLTGLQNRDGGFPAWDRGVTPWIRIGLKAAHAPEMSDDSQVDITARSIKAMVAVHSAYPNSEMASMVKDPIKKTCRFLEKQRVKSADSSLRLWRGEWMTNYLYGTSEAIGALLVGGCWSPAKARPYIEWIVSKQQQDGGWGESPESYTQNTYVESRSTLSQSEWVLSMLTVYEKMRAQNPNVPSVMPEIENGIGFLVDTMGEQKFPYETEFTGTFVRGVWYSRYVSLAHYEGIRALGGYLSLIPSVK
jgi:squalene cyclase